MDGCFPPFYLLTYFVYHKNSGKVTTLHSRCQSEGWKRIGGILPDVLIIPWTQISSLTNLVSTLNSAWKYTRSGSRTLEAPRGNRYTPGRGMRVMTIHSCNNLVVKFTYGRVFFFYPVILRHVPSHSFLPTG